MPECPRCGSDNTRICGISGQCVYWMCDGCGIGYVDDPVQEAERLQLIDDRGGM